MQKEIETLMKKKIELLKIPEAVEISENLTQDEKPVTRDKSLKKLPKHITPNGAFHEKKKKNTKVNLGGSYKIEIKKKYKKPKTRGQKR
jgi:ATP-dependent RNA helicase RhlE